MKSQIFSVKATGYSMYPVIVPGMQIMLKLMSTEDIRIGDIISIPSPTHADIRKKALQLITHRVIWKNGLKIYTKGDNNRHIDKQNERNDKNIYLVIGISYEGKIVSTQSDRFRYVSLLFLIYSYLSLVFPFGLLRGRRTIARFLLGNYS